MEEEFTVPPTKTKLPRMSVFTNKYKSSSINVASGVKKQADNSSYEMYKLLDLKGGGELIRIMKTAVKGKNYSALDTAIRALVAPNLYDGGLGRLIPISELVMRRNKERPKHKQIQMDKAIGIDNEGFVGNTGITNLGSSLADINGDIVFNKRDPSKYRECCWDLDNRGAVGETILHICVLHGTSLHLELAKRLIKLFPKLINDIYLADEYYGENVLHMAIVNEDPALVKFLLDNGANYNERTCGNFFSPEDQKMSRTDSLDHEWVDVCVKTNFEGYVYWGEYPLNFAACLSQEECFRLVLAKGANPNLQDTNGNTILHILVIHEKLRMFDMAYELGASMKYHNVQGLTPLTLAAKLAKRDMFMHILKLEREIYWQMGYIVCAAYPLQYLDTIDSSTGLLDNNSALVLIIYGDNIEHLELMEGVIVDLLVVKWNTFVKFRFYKMFASFFVYFLFTLICFLLRPVYEVRDYRKQTRIIEAMSEAEGGNDNVTSNVTDACYLFEYDDLDDAIRWVFECLTLAGAIFYLIGAARETSFLGYRMFIQNMMTVPSRVLFLFSCILIVIMVPLRFTCIHGAEDVIAVLAMLTTAPYFLFFCRGFKMVGPFVVMIYRMIQGDLLRFVAIYLVFVLGFSQAFYVIFQSHSNEKGINFFEDPIKSIVAMFIMSLQEFSDIYNEFDNTQLPVLAKFMFIIYMALVAILLINMLIAMMGNTYQIIAETRNEWQRQWARIVLVVERGVHPKERLRCQRLYSQPMADGRLALVIKHQMTEEDLEEIKEMREMRVTHLKILNRRQKGQRPISSQPGSPQKRGSEADIEAIPSVTSYEPDATTTYAR